MAISLSASSLASWRREFQGVKDIVMHVLFYRDIVYVFLA